MSKVTRINITEVIDWQGLSLSVTFDPDWSGLGYFAHMEVVTVKPDRSSRRSWDSVQCALLGKLSEYKTVRDPRRPNIYRSRKYSSH